MTVCWCFQDVSPAAFITDITSTVLSSNASFCEPNRCQITASEPTILKDVPSQGWVEIIDIVGQGATPREGVTEAFTALKRLLGDLETDLSCLARVNLYVGDMANYAEINTEYVKNFGLNPPVRVCVAVGKQNLPEGRNRSLLKALVKHSLVFMNHDLLHPLACWLIWKAAFCRSIFFRMKKGGQEGCKKQTNVKKTQQKIVTKRGN